MDVHLDALGYVGGWAQKAIKSDRDFDHLTLAQQFQALLRHQRAKGWKRLECSELFELQMEKKSGMSRYDSS